MKTYREFLESKMVIAPESGFDVDPSQVNPALKPHQRDAVVWAVKGGKRALFESFGLGKTVQELEFCRLVTEKEGGKALIVLPLGVKQEFARDAVNVLHWEKPPRYVRTMAEVEAAEETILMTNYERVRDGDIRPDILWPPPWTKPPSSGPSEVRPIRRSCQSSGTCPISWFPRRRRPPTATRN